MKPVRLFSFLIAASLLMVSAAGLAHESNLRGDSPHYSDEGWDVRLGLALVAVTPEVYRGMKDYDGLELLVDINYRNGNFFFSSNEDEALLLGYSLMRDENWVIDVVFAPKFAIDFDDDDMFDGQLAHLEERGPDGHLGARFSWYGNDNRVSLSLSRDVVGAHDGFMASIDYSQEWQLRNWIVTGRVGAAHFSEDMADEMVGVSAAEATVATPQFDAEAGSAVVFNLAAEYPVNEDWIFETRLMFAEFSSNIKDSPIVDGTDLSVLSVGFKYQF